jgi:hypothetical protein
MLYERCKRILAMTVYHQQGLAARIHNASRSQMSEPIQSLCQHAVHPIVSDTMHGIGIG